ncbi:MAG: phosphatidate cytidylyltransferase, partial [Anaerolineaceae bacterium]
MLKTRLVVIIIMIPVLVFISAWGGLPFALAVTLISGLAAWEFWRMFYRGGYAPSAVLTIGGAVVFCLQAYFQIGSLQEVLVALMMLTSLL